MWLLQSASTRNEKEHWDFGWSSGRIRRRAWGIPYSLVGSRVPSSLATSALWLVCYGAGDPAAARHFVCPSSHDVDWLSRGVRRGEGARRCPGPSSRGWSAIPHSRSRSLSRPLTRPFCDVLGVPLPAMSIDRWGPGMSREQRREPAGDPPLCAHTVDPTPITPVKVTYSGGNRESQIATCEVANA